MKKAINSYGVLGQYIEEDLAKTVSPNEKSCITTPELIMSDVLLGTPMDYGPGSVYCS